MRLNEAHLLNLLATYSLQREAHIVLREALGGCARTGHVIQFGELAALVERILVWKTMEHRGHPPRKSLHFPNPSQTSGRVLVEQRLAAAGIESHQSARQNLHIRNSQIQTLRASRRHNMRGVPS